MKEGETMAKHIVHNTNQGRKSAPARTPEARENQMIALAVDLAEKQMREGKASSQVITHYLKLGSPTERLKKDILENERELLAAKTEAIRSQKKSEELYSKALAAMKSYSGNDRHDYDN